MNRRAWASRITALVVPVVLVLGSPTVALAGWNEPVAASLNVDGAQDADNASITNVVGVPYVAWRENDGTSNLQVRAARLTDTGWAALGASLNVDTGRNADSPMITTIGSTPFLVWAEATATATQIRAKRFVNGGWSAVGGVLNVNAANSADGPSIADVAGVPYVTWSEGGAVQEVRVARFDGSAWVPVGGALNVNGANGANDPTVASVDGVPYVAWAEGGVGVDQIRVKRLVSGVWTSVGGSLNANPANGATSPVITGVQGVPHVVWEEDNGSVGEVRVARFTGSAWTPVGGGPLNVDPAGFGENTRIVAVGGVPMVAWDEQSSTEVNVYRAYVARFAAGTWSVVAGTLNRDAAARGDAPSLTDIGGVPYVAWNEGKSPTLRAQARVARLEPDFLSLTATPGLTDAVLTAQVRDFGIPLPIGFEYGSTFGSTTATQSSAGSGTATITQALNGLAPATAYPFRAFATDGTRRTATSPAQTFTTLTPPPPAKTPSPAAAKLNAGKVFTLPSAKTCLSKRAFRIRLKLPSGVKPASATVLVNGKRVKTLKAKQLTAGINLRGLPKGRFTVAITLKTSDGRTVKTSRRYRTCTKKVRR